jgi:NAD(P)-dependent dehydrogenase (short-subunit alcohol dehydrogenase family)
LARNPKTGEPIANEIIEAASKVKVIFLECNVESFASVQGAAKQITSFIQRLDILFWNTGIANTPPPLTEDVYKVHIIVNFISMFY